MVNLKDSKILKKGKEINKEGRECKIVIHIMKQWGWC